MGINKAPPKEHSTMQTFRNAMGWRQTQPMVRTLDERRATLGAFILTSRYAPTPRKYHMHETDIPISVALCMSKIDALRWNPHMEESLSVLADVRESPSDELLVTLVKIQLVMERTYYLRRDGQPQSPSEFYTKGFQSQLDAVKKQIPQHLQTDRESTDTLDI